VETSILSTQLYNILTGLMILKTIETEFNAIHSHGKKIKTEIRVPVEPFLELIHA